MLIVLSRTLILIKNMVAINLRQVLQLPRLRSSKSGGTPKWLLFGILGATAIAVMAMIPEWLLFAGIGAAVIAAMRPPALPRNRDH